MNKLLLITAFALLTACATYTEEERAYWPPMPGPYSYPAGSKYEGPEKSNIPGTIRNPVVIDRITASPNK